MDAITSIDLEKVFDRAHIEAAYGELTDVTLKENLPKGKSSLEDIRVTAETVPALLEAAKTLPTAEEAEEMLKAAGAPVSNAEIGLPYDEAFIEKTLTYAPYVRNRLTLLKVIQASKR